MAKSKEVIIDEIVEHILERGGDYGQWYVGRGHGLDARDLLFHAHHVREKGDRWIHRRADSSTTAKEIARYFTTTLSTDGASDAPVANADTVYAYRKAPHTSP
jgi:hypothetical protein